MGIHLCLWLFSIITSCSSSWNGFNDEPNLRSTFYNLNWMKDIPENTLVSAISIPGTYESFSLHGGPLVRSQVWKLKDQLNVGIRYFDMHVGIWHKHKQLNIDIRDKHFMFDQNIRLDQVIEIMLDFLENSADTVLLKVRIHWLFRSYVRKLIEQLIEKHEDKIWTMSSVPKMQEARGKIIIVKSETFNVGIENRDSVLCEKKKFTFGEEKIIRLKSDICNHTIIVTACVAGLTDFPKKLAKNVNKQLLKFLVEQKYELNHNCLGVFSMNYPSPDLIKNIIQLKICQCDMPGFEGETPQPTVEPGTTAELTTEINPDPTTEPGTTLNQGLQQN
uniref:1-phosphatidylinositol phosphodiesterase-like n=1 Tax=Gasterosteus aculeatus aculeatus TaxID=481459 RepID=UPI001A990503|nr:1-phosphatidylinositol phosphodiesterase-like [Gasterosteus aculeatus aculeatus]